MTGSGFTYLRDDMDVTDVSKRKRVLENQILASIEEFERDTLTTVMSVDVQRFEVTGERDHVLVTSRVEVQ